MNTKQLNQPQVCEYFYRYEEQFYSLGVDEFDNVYPGHDTKLHLQKYKVIKKTPKGFWIALSCGDFECSQKHFVLTKARKKYACSTKQEALESYLFRKKSQIKILKAKLGDAEYALRLGESLKEK